MRTRAGALFLGGARNEVREAYAYTANTYREGKGKCLVLCRSCILEWKHHFSKLHHYEVRFGNQYTVAVL